MVLGTISSRGIGSGHYPPAAVYVGDDMHMVASDSESSPLQRKDAAIPQAVGQGSDPRISQGNAWAMDLQKYSDS